MPDVNPYVNLRTLPVPMRALVENGLTPTQWIICYLLHFELWSDYVAYTTGPDSPQGFDPEELNDLHSRFYLIFEPKDGDHPKLSPKNFRVSERFTDLLEYVGKCHKPLLPTDKAPYQAPRPSVFEQRIQPSLEGLDHYDELFALYPSHIPVQGSLVSGRSGDQDLMAASYAKALQKPGVTHEQVLELVHWAKEQSPSMITMGLQKFIASREWLGLQQLKDSGLSGGTFNTQEAI